MGFNLAKRLLLYNMLTFVCFLISEITSVKDASLTESDIFWANIAAFNCSTVTASKTKVNFILSKIFDKRLLLCLILDSAFFLYI